MRIASIVLLMCLIASSWGCGGGGGYRDREGKPTPNPQGELEQISGSNAPDANQSK